MSSFDLANYKLTYGLHRDQKVIFFHFPYSSLHLTQLKSVVKLSYTRTHKAWYCIDLPMYRRALDIAQNDIAESLESKIHPVNLPEFLLMRDLLQLKGYSPNTVKTYLHDFYHFLKLIKHRSARDFDEDRIKAYLLYCMNILRFTDQTIHSHYNSLKFYYLQVLDREDVFFKIPRPRKPSSLPKVMSKQEIKKMIEQTENIKHRVILQLVYGMGLRVSEIVGLKLTDYHRDRQSFHIRCAKGKKDRYVPAPQSVRAQLNEYYRQYKPKEFLFEGQVGGQYTIRSTQAVFKQAMKRAGVDMPIGIHGLRHSYATHLLEAGTDITIIQKLLGHSNLKTTLIYAKVSQSSIDNIISPLDTIF